MPTPAEAYAAARTRSPQFTAFEAEVPFPLDPFQVTACQALARGEGVLVAAPTGAGKTIVGEFAVFLALTSDQKCFYTTPIKALSNQKYAELVDRYGSQAVGLLTGDNSINGEAPIVVMTTEVLRNMIYADSRTLDGLGYVVMDEVHYLADRFRGAVWEEVIIHLPERVTLIALSATVSNAEEFGAWLQEVRGHTTVVVEEHRPVPLWQHVMAGDHLHDLFIDDDLVNPDLVRLMQRSGRPHPRRRDPLTPWRTDVVDRLQREGLLPAIYFLFSRAGCDDAVEQCVRSGMRLTTKDERREIRAQVMAATLGIPDEDLAALRYDDWLTALERGIAAHHAGMLPAFKEITEALFQQGLIKVVFATETLALGINMPAKSVILEKLVKWNGEQHVALTPGEYTQLTGRAGRRGIDVEGHAVVLWHQGLDPRVVAGLASTRTYPLKSSFQPSYNMAVNLVATMGRHTAREVLETSFAQYQADRSVVGLARSLRKLEEARDGYAEAMVCHLGDFAEYAALRQQISESEKASGRERAESRRRQADRSLAELRRGDVFWLPVGKRPGPVVVVDAQSDRPAVLTVERRVRRISVGELRGPIDVVTRLRVPKNFQSRDAGARRELARHLAALDIAAPARGASAQVDERATELRKQLRQHPCHGCSDREAHARWAERWNRVNREIAETNQRIAGRTTSIAKRFDSICAVLSQLGYLSSDDDNARVTASGEQLRRLYTESDLLASQCLRDGLWRNLEPAELAAVASTLVYESRLAEESTVRLPRGPIADTVARMHDVWNAIHDIESTHRLDLTRQPDPGFVWPTYRWANGATLSDVLRRDDLTAGDFVRWIRQVIDVLGQMSDASPDTKADAAITLLRRGVVVSLEGRSESVDGTLDTPLGGQGTQQPGTNSLR
jgi:ATP-dependent RNA helicase HelY